MIVGKRIGHQESAAGKEGALGRFPRRLDVLDVPETVTLVKGYIHPQLLHVLADDGLGGDDPREDPFAETVDNPEAVDELFKLATEEASGGFPEWLLDMAKNQEDAPGCTDLAARA